jgi:predicted Zn-ribbon and HTH transcriptional regulator
LHQEQCPGDKANERPPLEVADIFRAHGATYRESHVLTVQQQKVMRAIAHCRTEALGGHVDVCEQCGHASPSFNSCRNRHCPKCQSLDQARWIEERKARLLPTSYFHVVFTLPANLRQLALRNQRRFYDLLFSAASATLLELGRDEKRLGGQIGITAVLHTWRRDLQFHPHLHCIVTGGGLAPNEDRWIRARGGERYLFPVKVLSRLFRGKFLDELSCAVDRGEIDLGELTDEAFLSLKKTLYNKEWVVYAKRPFAGPVQVFLYLGRYTHRVGLSNQRLRSIDANGITFSTKDGGSVTVSPDEFIRRFLLHVLPRGFFKIRHFGLMASGNATTKLEVARQLLDAQGEAWPPDSSGEGVESLQDLLDRLPERDPDVCPRCKVGRLIRLTLREYRELSEAVRPDT